MEGSIEPSVTSKLDLAKVDDGPAAVLGPAQCQQIDDKNPSMTEKPAQEKPAKAKCACCALM